MKFNHVPNRKAVAPSATVLRNSKTNLDVDVAYRFWKQTSFFVQGTNITRVPGETYYDIGFAPNSLLPDYARLREHTDFGVQWVVGLKGRF
ncbi:MAG: hypothetical protein FJ399_12515 [Verrucomicrobia bacterium]|nr:hypothetical protein [Verrucomicrobiota bacterium]